MEVLAMHVFLCVTPAPCPCRALENHLGGRRTSINCSNGGDRADTMFWSTNCWKAETCAACPCGLPLAQRRWGVDTSLRFELIFYIYFLLLFQDGPVRYAVSILFVLVHMSGCYGAEPNCIPRVLNNQRNNIQQSSFRRLGGKWYRQRTGQTELEVLHIQNPIR